MDLSLDRKQRVLATLSGTLTDLSAGVNDYVEDSIAIPVTDTDAIYIGSELPFNHKFIEIETPNAIASVMTVKIWDGSAFTAVLDLVDETSSDGKTLAQSGKVSFTPDRDRSGWGCEYKSKDIDDLADGPQMFDLYWAKLEFSASITATSQLKYVGQRFCTDRELFQIYPDLNSANMMASFRTGQSNWIEQEVIASEEIVDNLRQRRVIIRRDQIMDTSLLKTACRHKTAEIIYRGLGNGHIDNRILATKDFASSMAKKFFEVDRNGDGAVSKSETRATTSFGSR